jgi:uncharacterized protein YdaU (DUF1376 family)
MTKDPAVLLYIDKWLIATKSMPSDARGWYLNLILTQYDRGGELPNDLEELAVICDVKFSEYQKFTATWEQVLKQKFKQNDNGTLYNELCFDILKKRETFKLKRENSGAIGFVVKISREVGYKEDEIENLKNWTEISTLFKKDKQVLKQELKQIHKLFINVDVNTDIDDNEVDNKKAWFEIFWNAYGKKQDSKKCLEKWMKLSEDEINAALDKVDAYVASTPDVTYRKNPLTWLNGKCWQDEIIKPTTSAKATNFDKALNTDLHGMLIFDK